MKYVKAGTIQNLIAQADKENRPLFITAPIGWGKTAAIEYYYRRVSHVTIDCADGKIEQKTPPARIRQRVIVFDNISYLEEEASKKYVIDMLKFSDKHIIFTSRAPRPSWLMGKTTEEKVVLADHRDMRLSREQIYKILEDEGVNTTEEEKLKVLEDSRYNPLILSCIINYMKESGVYTQEVNTFARIQYHSYLDNEFLGRLSEEEREFLLAMCWYPSFQIELARLLNNGNDCRHVIDSIQKKDAYILTFSSAGVQLFDSVIVYLRHKRNILWSDEKNSENLCKAAEYYVKHGNTRTALQCYRNAHAEKEYIALLEKTAEESASSVSVYNLIDFYTSLDEETVGKSWQLVSAMSMAQSLLIKPVKAEYWFDYLKGMYEKEEDPEIKTKIENRYDLLDLVLPHHGNKNIKERFRKGLEACHLNWDWASREYIDMMPTFLHGAIDFCDASKDEEKLYEELTSFPQIVQGRPSKGSLDILKAEIAYEKDKLDDFQIHRLLDRGYMIADADDSFAGCFASVGTSVHLNLYRGNSQRAEELLDSIRKKAVDVKNDILLSNIDALYSWVDQLHSRRESVAAWLETAPDEGVSFSFLQRSVMLCKVRAYIILDRYDAALDLIERLLVFFEMYDRVYAYYETMIYKAIIYYRVRNPAYREVFNEVLRKANELGFYHLICDHGVAVLPLMDKEKPADVDSEYYSHLLKMTKQMAENFPNYMMTTQNLKDPLTKTERRVLHLLCEGLNADEICEIMNITYSGIKFHNKNIYRKLGVSNRTEAVRKAIMLGLNDVEPHIG